MMASQVADRPHRLSLAFSMIAILISAASWYESHAGRAANERASRAAVQITAFQAKQPLDVPPADSKSLAAKDLNRYFEVTLTNLGRSTASQVTWRWNYDLIGEQREGWVDATPLKFSRLFLKNEVTNLAPGRSQAAVIGTLIAPEQQIQLATTDSKLVFFGLVTYLDEAGGRQFEEPWCYSIAGYDKKSLKTGTFLPCDRAGNARKIVESSDSQAASL